MHELAVCQALLNQVLDVAKDNDASKVETIEIHWGPLSGIEVDLLQRAFDIAQQGTIASDAILLVKKLPVRVTCTVCGEESEVPSNQLLCRYCGNWRTQLVSGDDMLLAQVVLEK